MPYFKCLEQVSSPDRQSCTFGRGYQQQLSIRRSPHSRGLGKKKEKTFNLFSASRKVDRRSAYSDDPWFEGEVSNSDSLQFQVITTESMFVYVEVMLLNLNRTKLLDNFRKKLLEFHLLLVKALNLGKSSKLNS